MRIASGVLCALLLSIASAQTGSLGVTYQPASPNGQSLSAQAHVDIFSFPFQDGALSFGARADVTMPTTFDLYPSTNVGITLRTPELADAVLYAGSGLGLLFTRIGDVACWDLTWTFHGGIDVGLTDNLFARVDFTTAPLIQQLNLGFGVGMRFGD